MRGTMTSIVQFTSVLIGFGLGPVMVGMLSDFYGGGVMIRYALATGLLVFIPVVLFLAIASRMLYGRRGDGESPDTAARSGEHTSELQSLMRNSYAVFCLKKKN